MKSEAGSKDGSQEQPREGNLLLNVGKIIFLIVVLIAAWFILDWLISGK